MKYAPGLGQGQAPLSGDQPVLILFEHIWFLEGTAVNFFWSWKEKVSLDYICSIEKLRKIKVFRFAWGRKSPVQNERKSTEGAGLKGTGSSETIPLRYFKRFQQ